jgi:hypothetical protein
MQTVSKLSKYVWYGHEGPQIELLNSGNLRVEYFLKGEGGGGVISVPGTKAEGVRDYGAEEDIPA